MGSELTHTHYDPYGPPYQVPGTLLDCDATTPHCPDNSEIFADYMYSPELVPGVSGLGPLVDEALLAAFMRNRTPTVRPVLTEVIRVPVGYEATITIRRPDGTGWHSEKYTFDYSTGRVERIVTNPHPGYEHWPAFCPNCGY